MKTMIGTAATILVADQATKWYVLGPLALDQRLFVPVIDPYINFVMAWNTGINFGLFGSDTGWMRWVLIAVALGICAFVLVWLKREGAPRGMQIATGLLVGGAIGNVIDRIRFGAVADFLNMSCCGFTNPYAFNVADISIFVGAGLLILLSGREGSGTKGAAKK
ncbi:signal peptidase II [Roseibaca sp. Y0-43]|uniref:signal peptidase II n=1 Tax=Roseibaca sp. Y0-43 TaxID=2816854 RepID=UPI001D0C9F2E|nr:signal peptidase II [Roseibaca sp. Y0-43]MCC1480059.1 signal peptidase II [Roseibaca sp. Y0-43]